MELSASLHHSHISDPDVPSTFIFFKDFIFLILPIVWNPYLSPTEVYDTLYFPSSWKQIFLVLLRSHLPVCLELTFPFSIWNESVYWGNHKDTTKNFVPERLWEVLIRRKNKKAERKGSREGRREILCVQRCEIRLRWTLAPGLALPDVVCTQPSTLLPNNLTRKVKQLLTVLLKM